MPCWEVQPDVVLEFDEGEHTHVLVKVDLSIDVIGEFYCIQLL